MGSRVSGTLAELSIISAQSCRHTHISRNLHLASCSSQKLSRQKQHFGWLDRPNSEWVHIQASKEAGSAENLAADTGFFTNGFIETPAAEAGGDFMA